MASYYQKNKKNKKIKNKNKKNVLEIIPKKKILNLMMWHSLGHIRFLHSYNLGTGGLPFPPISPNVAPLKGRETFHSSYNHVRASLLVQQINKQLHF